MLNAAASLSAKQTGMDRAMENVGPDTKAKALEELRAWCRQQLARGVTEMCMEHFRADSEVQLPSPKGWGPLATAACKARIIEPLKNADGSPVYRAAESVKTHGHPVRAYRLIAA